MTQPWNKKIEMEKERIQKEENKEKLRQLYIRAKSPRPNRRLMEDASLEGEIQSK